MKKKVIKPKKVKKIDEKSSAVPLPKEQEDRFDFGGLPEINLKKNLGCGWFGIECKLSRYEKTTLQNTRKS